MDAHAIVCDASQRFRLEEVVLPDPGPTDVLIRIEFSGISIGTEFALIRGKISWGPYPLCTGYQAVGTVERVGEDVRGFSVGDVVFLRDNRSIQRANGERVSAVAGTHASHAVVDPSRTHGIDHLPDGVDRAAGSLFVMPAVGLNGVDMSNPRLGDVVVVHGVGLIGLGVVAACRHRGCVVVAVDVEDRRLETAVALGADRAINGSREDVGPALRSIASEGADVVFEATGNPACVDPALALCRTHGKFVYQGHYGTAPLSYTFSTPHGKRLTAFYPCDDGLAPCRRAVLRNMAMGALDWGRVITHRVESSEAAEFFAAILRGNERNVLGAVIHWG